MNPEKKKITDAWDEKKVDGSDVMRFWDKLIYAHQHIQKCVDILADTDFPVYYDVTEDRINAIMDRRVTLNEYVWQLPDEIYRKLDKPFYEDFVNGATEMLSRIRLEDFRTGNTLGVTQVVMLNNDRYGDHRNVDALDESRIRRDMDDVPQVSEQVQLYLTFSDFLGTIDADEERLEGLLTSPRRQPGYVEEFAVLFAGQYEALEASGALDGGEIEGLDDYLEILEQMGEFGHRMDKPVLRVLNDILDMLIIPAVIEGFTGTEILTGEDLSDVERAMKLVGAAVDAATLGQAMAATHITSLGVREGLQMAGKVALIEFGSNLAAYEGMMIGEALGLPVPVTVVLGMMAGVTVELGLGRLVFRGSDGRVLRTVETPGPAGELTDLAEQVPYTAPSYRSLADGMSPEDMERYLYFQDYGSITGLTDAELYGISK